MRVFVARITAALVLLCVATIWAFPDGSGGVVSFFVGGTVTSVSSANPLPVTSSGPVPSPSASIGITPVVCGACTNLAIKAAPGNLYSVYATNPAAGYLMVFNAASVPANGATTAGSASGNMVECVGPGVNPAIAFSGLPPEVYSVGIVAAFSSTNCATLTLSSATIIHGYAQ